MAACTICCVGLGFIAIHTSWVVGEVKLVFPGLHHYGDAGSLLRGRFGEEFLGAMFVLQLILITGSDCLTGTIAFDVMTIRRACSLVLGVIPAVVLFGLAVMPSFTEAAILGYVGFRVNHGRNINHCYRHRYEAANTPAGISGSDWSAWPKPGTTVSDAFIAIANMVFAYSFSVYQFFLIDEMHNPTDYIKSVWTSGLLEMIVYTLTGSLIYLCRLGCRQPGITFTEQHHGKGGISSHFTSDIHLWCPQQPRICHSDTQETREKRLR